MSDYPLGRPADPPSFPPPPSPARVSEHPLMLYQGQPISREIAATRRAELMANSEYAQAALNGDVAKQIELKDLWMLERGMEPSPPPPATVADVNLQQLDREQRAYLEHDAVLRQHFDLSDEQRHEIVHQCPIAQWEKDAIAERHARNLKDEGFRERLRRREPGAVRDEYIANYVRVAPVARTQADIDAWKSAHPFRPRS